MQNELMTCIKYFLRMEAIDSTEALDLVIKALEESGLAFEEAIEMISFNIGFLEHPVLGKKTISLKNFQSLYGVFNFRLQPTVCWI